MASRAENLTNPNFIGKRWGIRVLIFCGHFLVFYFTGELTLWYRYSGEYSAVYYGLFAGLGVLAVELLLFRLTRNMFRKNYLKYGFYCLIAFILGGYASTNHTRIQREWSAYLESDRVQEKLSEIRESTQEGELPYSTTDEANRYFAKMFPESIRYTEDLWRWQLMQTGNGLLIWVLVTIYVVSVSRYLVRRRRLKRAGTDVNEGYEAACDHDSLSEEQTQEEQPPQARKANGDSLDVQASGCTCATCGTEYSTGYKYCPECGEPVGVKHCPRCGCEVEEDFSFCAECGCELGRPEK